MINNSSKTNDLNHILVSMENINRDGSKELNEPLKHNYSQEILPVELLNYEPPFVLIPMFKWIRELKQNWLNDVIAGLTVASILIPQSLA